MYEEELSPEIVSLDWLLVSISEHSIIGNYVTLSVLAGKNSLRWGRNGAQPLPIVNCWSICRQVSTLFTKFISDLRRVLVH